MLSCETILPEFEFIRADFQFLVKLIDEKEKKETEGRSGETRIGQTARGSVPWKCAIGDAKSRAARANCT